MIRQITFAAILGLLLTIVPLTPAADGHREKRLIGGWLDVDVMINNYTRLVARKYDLTAEQADWTRDFVIDKAHTFIDRHEDSLYGSIGRMFEVRQGGDMTQQELIEWGERVQPIWQDAKELIVGANDEFRAILTEDQKTIHDRDLDLMYQSFDMTEDQLDRIVAGEMTVEEFRNPPRMRPRATRRPVPPATPAEQAEPVPPVTPQATPTPPRTGTPSVGNDPTGKRPPSRPDDKPAPPEPPSEPEKFLASWDKYVADFVKRYGLVDAQEQKAESILKSCKLTAEQYLRRQRRQLDRIEKQIAEAKQAKPANEEAVTKLEKRQAALMEPLTEIFEKQLKPRLEQLPTRAQRAAAAKKKDAKTDKESDKKK